MSGDNTKDHRNQCENCIHHKVSSSEHDTNCRCKLTLFDIHIRVCALARFDYGKPEITDDDDCPSWKWEESE